MFLCDAMRMVRLASVMLLESCTQAGSTSPKRINSKPSSRVLYSAMPAARQCFAIDVPSESHLAPKADYPEIYESCQPTKRISGRVVNLKSPSARRDAYLNAKSLCISFRNLQNDDVRDGFTGAVDRAVLPKQSRGRNEKFGLLGNPQMRKSGGKDVSLEGSPLMLEFSFAFKAQFCNLTRSDDRSPLL